MNRISYNNVLLVCSIVCAVCGLIILGVCLFGNGTASYGRIFLGALNVVNGCMFFLLSRKKF